MNSHFNVLLATDYSEAVMNAERYAVQFARNTGAHLKILHVYAPPMTLPVPPFENVQLDNDKEEYEKDRVKQHAKMLVNSLYLHEEISYSYMVREGNTSTEILDVAKEADIDFIITGAHGAKGFSEMFFGSNTWNIIRKSDIPVLAVPEDALYTGVNNIVFAVELREGEIKTLPYVVKLAQLFDAELTLVHVSNGSLPIAFDTKFYEDFINEVREKISYPKLNFRFLQFENVTDGLNDFCIKSKTNWLVMSPEKHVLFDKLFQPGASKTRRMTFHSSIPLLAVPDSYKSEKIFSVTAEHLEAKV